MIVASKPHFPWKMVVPPEARRWRTSLRMSPRATLLRNGSAWRQQWRCREAELEEVSGHEHEQHQTRKQLLNPSPLRNNEKLLGNTGLVRVVEVDLRQNRDWPDV